jgi:hypothetical protein
MMAGWPQKIQAAQLIPCYTIGGKDLPRVRYGSEAEDWGANQQPCHDCSVIKGEFHVPGCDAERCPSCWGQAISCDCPEAPAPR